MTRHEINERTGWTPAGRMKGAGRSIRCPGPCWFAGLLHAEWTKFRMACSESA
jgi:hypothetical protein